jgi:pre-60S factor REI1
VVTPRTCRSRVTEKSSVYNLKRRIASLPPISANIYHEQVIGLESENEIPERLSPFDRSCIAWGDYCINPQAGQAHLDLRNHALELARVPEEDCSLDSFPLKSRENGQPADSKENFSPRQCLFCNAESASMEANLGHMSYAHSFFIPNAAYLTDMESLISYLFILISDFHECLYCGSERSSKLAVQDHMRGKGHCRLDFGSDVHKLVEFYDFDDATDKGRVELGHELVLVPDEDELRLPSGRLLTHRSRAHGLRQRHSEHRSSTVSPRLQLPLEVEPEARPIVSSDRRIALRAGTSTSMTGVPELQQRALLVFEKKILKIETREKSVYESKVERGNNSQKRYRAVGIGKKRGGLEKRLG